MLKDIDIKIHEDYYEKLELNRKKNGGYKPEDDVLIFQEIAEELGLTKEEVEENFNRNEQEFEADLVYAEHKEEIDRLESEAEEFYGKDYKSHLEEVEVQNEKRKYRDEYRKFAESIQEKCDKSIGYLSKKLNRRVKVSPSVIIGGEEIEHNVSIQIFNNETDYRGITIPYCKITENKEIDFNESLLNELTEILLCSPESVHKYKASYFEKVLYIYINSLDDYFYYIDDSDLTLCCSNGVIYDDSKDELICYTDDIKAITFESDGIAKIYLDDEKDSDYEDIDYILLRPDSYAVIKLTQEELQERIERSQRETYYKNCQEDCEKRQKEIDSIIASKYPNQCPRCGEKLILALPPEPHIDDSKWIECTKCDWSKDFTKELEDIDFSY